MPKKRTKADLPTVRRHPRPEDHNWQSLAEIRARETERAAEKRFSDMMAAAGVDAQRTATELLYLLPDGFKDSYTNLFHRALRGADAGTAGRGESTAASRELLKGKGKARTGGKRFKRHWVVADEKALELKERIDKRLRALAREVDIFLEGKGEVKRKARRCHQGHLMTDDKDVKFCSRCGSKVEDRKGATLEADPEDPAIERAS